MKQHTTQSTLLMSIRYFITFMSLLLMNNFSTHAQIKMVSPNGGETWPVGSQQNITWTWVNTGTVSLTYSTDGGNTFNIIAGAVGLQAKSSPFVWTIPNSPSSQCLVKAFHKDGIMVSWDVSNAVFTISSSTGISEAVNAISVIIYPNPFSIQATFSLGKEVNDGSLIIYDLSGKEVRNINFSGSQVTMKREDLSNGSYFYQIISRSPIREKMGEVISSGKIIVQ